ncbi:MAG: hypothetical protein QGH20_10010 [Candidatus Latescibacteria bacterium]|nr:hypothetical protein [Candidatus Latescibacterota bacterium]
MAGIVVTGVVFHQHQKRAFRREAWDELSAIADLKIREIASWRRERIGDAQVIAHTLAAVIQGALDDAADPALP